MNKKIITGLILLMGIGIMGVIAVQIIWMNNAFKIKNELFSRNVNEAMNSSVRKFEFHQNMTFARQMMNLPKTEEKSDLLSSKASVKKSPHKVQSLASKSKRKNSGNNLNVDSLINHEYPSSIIIQSPGFSAKIENAQPLNDKQVLELQKRILKMRQQMQLFAENEMKRLETNPYGNPFEGDKTFPTEPENLFPPDLSGEEEINSHSQINSNASKPISTQKKSTAIKEKKQKTLNQKQINQINNFRLKENEIQIQTDRMFLELQNMKVGRHIDLSEIKKLVRKELQNRDIPINFEFAIADAGKIRYLSNPVDKNLILNSSFSVPLFPHDLIPKSTRLLVFFPNQHDYIHKSLNWLLIVSNIFSLLVFVTFFFSVYFILKQKKLSEMKADFLNNMTHEFKTPIATIGVAADSLLNKKVIDNHEKISYFTNMIRKENHRMNDHVEKILTMARLERKDLGLHFQKVDAHELIEKVVARFELTVQSKQGKIALQLEASNSMITTDPTHFASMVGNLIDNANKYSPDCPDILVSTRDGNNGIIISVKDHGIGMSSAVQQKIFEKFYRESSGNVHNVKGFGLGLSYVKAIVSANHGTISVNSEPGKGSLFDVFIPYVVTNKSTINE